MTKGIFNDLTGKRFGKLKVIKREASDKWQFATWFCQCDCGNTTITRGSYLISGVTKSCGCKKGNKLDGTEQYGWFFGDVFNGYVKHAKARDIEWNLEIDQVNELIQGKCFYCGVEKYNCRLDRYKYNGIDRLDSSKGYTPENCVSCCSRCNYFKGTMPYDEFINMIKSIYKYHVLKGQPA